MDATEAEILALNLMAEFSVTGWRFAWDRSVRRFGECRHRVREIGLSQTLTELNDRAEVEDVIRHEIAHALAGPKTGHDRAWRRQCAVTGARPERCYDDAAVKKPPAPYRVECPRCGTIGERFRRARGKPVHTRCGSKVTFVRIGGTP
jgi:predicted SprT family Zn-dependent metalloprotease